MEFEATMKRVPHTRHFVDGFRCCPNEASRWVFLSHIHSDHTCGLKRRFSGTICCSPETRLCLREQFGTQLKVREIRVGETLLIDEGTSVVAHDANHCPGALIFVFSVLHKGKRFVVVHTGDFRYDARFHCGLPTKVDFLFLDTTYSNPKHDFWCLDDCLAKVRAVARTTLKQFPSTLFVSGSYTVGKEKVVLALNQELGSSIFCSERKYRFLTNVFPAVLKRFCIDMTAKRKFWEGVDSTLASSSDGVALSSTFAASPYSADKKRLEKMTPKTGCILLLNDMNLNPERLERLLDEYPQFTHVCAFSPSGWCWNRSMRVAGELKKATTGLVTVYSVPYSEHSSFPELCEFVKLSHPKRIVPTVSGGAAESKRIVERFVGLMDLKQSRSRLDFYLKKKKKKKGSGSEAVQEAVSSPSLKERGKKPKKGTLESFFSRAKARPAERTVDLQEVDVEEQARLWKKRRLSPGVVQ